MDLYWVYIEYILQILVGIAEQSVSYVYYFLYQENAYIIVVELAGTRFFYEFVGHLYEVYADVCQMGGRVYRESDLGRIKIADFEEWHIHGHCVFNEFIVVHQFKHYC